MNVVIWGTVVGLFALVCIGKIDKEAAPRLLGGHGLLHLVTRLPSMAQQPRVFISYARRDGETFAAELVRRLEDESLGDRRVPVWRDREALRGGEGWWSQIERELE